MANIPNIPKPWRFKPALYTSTLVYIAVQVAFLSFLCSYYNYGIGNFTRWTLDQLEQTRHLTLTPNLLSISGGTVLRMKLRSKCPTLSCYKWHRKSESCTQSPESRYLIEHASSMLGRNTACRNSKYDYTREKIGWMKEFWKDTKENVKIPKRKATLDDVKTIDAEVNVASNDMQIFNTEQLALFDGSRASRPVYLAILGRVYNVDKGRKHYGKGGGYHFFAGRDATRAFVSGDFTEAGLVDNTDGLSHEDLLGIRDWVSFYEKDYKLVGVLVGRYYDSNGMPTKELKHVLARMQTAAEWKKSKADEAEVFPPCNSEWHQNSGGRVWCSMKSGGIQRDWVGVPRLLYDPNTKQQRCACVKNFGTGLSSYGEKGNRGDLDHPNLRQYPKCSPVANSCRLEND